ncbi:hypothetical protein BDQ17DRAFT_1368399 [Cyathus striatus]|nr:hypothetical protein BDQ17DRAFT_1368399 [Cyathus striatus]
MRKSDEEVNVLKLRVSEINEWRSKQTEDSEYILESVELSSREGTPVPVGITVLPLEKSEKSTSLPTPPISPHTGKKRPAESDVEEGEEAETPISYKRLRFDDSDHRKSEERELSKKSDGSKLGTSAKDKILKAKRSDRLKLRQWILKKAKGAL